MRFKKVLFIFLLPVVAEVAVACCQCDEQTVYRRYSNRYVSVDNLDNTGSEPVVTNSGLLPKRAYGIRVRVQGEEVVSRGGRVPSFFQSAYAVDCDCPVEEEWVAVDRLTALRIITVSDFDATHPADADVSAYFKVYDVTGNSLLTVDSWLGDWQPSLDVAADLLLMTAPEEGGTHQFKIEVTLSDGRVLEAETTPIMFME